ERESRHVDELLWPLRGLLYLLVERQLTAVERKQTGQAARAVLRTALDRPNTPAHLIVGAIDFVGATYATDVPESRDLFRRLMEPQRFAASGDREIPWLARKIKPIMEVDPDFAGDIYELVFGNEISDTSTTSLGNSQILPLLSNRKQDYD